MTWEAAGEPLITTAEMVKEFADTPCRVLAKDRGVE